MSKRTEYPVGQAGVHSNESILNCFRDVSAGTVSNLHFSHANVVMVTKDYLAALEDKYSQLRDAVMGSSDASDVSHEHIVKTATEHREAKYGPLKRKLVVRCRPSTEVVDRNDPEYRTVDSFIRFMKDEDRVEYTHEELAAVNFRTHINIQSIRKFLANNGLNLAVRPIEKKPRGVNTSSHDRWYGPGAARTHGGAGIDPTTGRANAGGTV